MNWNPEDWWSIPAEMQNLAQWMVCGADKVPQTLSGYRGDPTNPANWAKFTDAVLYAERHSMWVGFCLSDADPLLVIDMDNKKGDPNDFARIEHIGRQLDTYIERSMSGQGYHAVMYGDIGLGRRQNNIEVYSQDRFMVMTGDYVLYRPIKRDDEWVQGLVASMETVVTVDDSYEDKAAERTDDAVMQAIMSSKSGEKFARLMGEQWSLYTDERTGQVYGSDPSSADMALATIISFFTPNNAQVWSIFARSTLAKRIKNGQPRHPNGSNFIKHTVGKARAYNSRDAERSLKDNFSEAAANMLAAKVQQATLQKAHDVAIATGQQPTTLAQAAAPVPNSAIAPGTRTFPTKRARDIVEEPAIEWAVQSIFQHKHVNAVYGWSGVGKSFITLDMAASIATGGEWFGYKTTQLPVLYVAIEGGSSLNQRIAAYEKGTGALYPQDVEFYRGKFKLNDADMITDFIAQRKVHGKEGGVIIIDTLSKAMAGVDENSNAEMSKVVEQLELLRDGLNACVIVVHHSTKPDAKTGVAGHMRGAGALQAGIEGVLEVIKRPIFEEGLSDEELKKAAPIGYFRALKTSKVKDGSDLGFDEFDLKVVETGKIDNFGDKITSCYIEKVQSAPIRGGSANAPVGGSTYDYAKPDGGVTRKEERASIRAQSKQGAPVPGVRMGVNKQFLIEAIQLEGARARKTGAYNSGDKHPAPFDGVVSTAADLKNGADKNSDRKVLRKALVEMMDGPERGTLIQWATDDNDPKKTRWIWLLA